MSKIKFAGPVLLWSALAALSASEAALCASGTRTGGDVATLSLDDMNVSVGGAEDCNDQKSNSTACVDGPPATCRAGTTTFCAADPNDATMCVQHVDHSYDKCRQVLDATKGWNCTPNEQTYGCRTLKKGPKVDGKCPESTCASYGTCGAKVQLPENRSCVGG